MQQTLAQIVTRCTVRLSMVSGVGVQIYAEDRLADMVQSIFTQVRDMLWWDDLMTYVTLTQDANGRPVENVLSAMPVVPIGDEIVISKFSDIQYVWSQRRRDPLKDMPRRGNPSGALKQGNTLYKLADAQKVIRVAPFEPGSLITLRYKVPEPTFNADTVIPFDSEVLMLGAVYEYLEDDGTNPGQIEKYRNNYNARLQMLVSEENEKEIPLTPLPFADNDGWIEIT
jgi:hypothetical protein